MGDRGNIGKEKIGKQRNETGKDRMERGKERKHTEWL